MDYQTIVILITLNHREHFRTMGNFKFKCKMNINNINIENINNIISSLKQVVVMWITCVDYLCGLL